MTIYDFIKKYDGKTIGFPAGSFVGECLSLVKQWMLEKYNFNPPASGCNGARCYWSMFPDPLGKYFEKIPNTKEFIPQTDDVMVWDGNAGAGAGHISIVLNDADHPANTQYFWSFDQNWNGRQAHLVRHNYNNVYGVLRPKGGSMANMYKGLDLGNPEAMKPAVDIWYQVMIEKLWVKASDLKVIFDKLGVNSVEKLGAEIDNRLEQISRLKAQVTTEVSLRNTLMQEAETNEKIIKGYENELVERQGKINDLSAKIGELNQTIAELKKQADEGTVILPEPTEPNYMQLFFKWLYERLAK